ncbi:acylphosphatase [Nonomuraea polychroma]|uniref:acylphosphatase n=1 Tax=Nonomuraea polychroma TaxID=46176 RepID=UPI003D8D7AF2
MTVVKHVDVHVEGVVRGVGFRPFVRSLATRLGPAGRVRGDVTGVHIETEGALAGVEEFLTALERDAPALSAIERVTVVRGEPAGHRGFTIARTAPCDRPHTSMAGHPLCPACAAEFHDPASRRFQAPATGCPADLAQARRLCEIDDSAAELLAGRARPIVLLPRLPGAPVAAAVAPGHRTSASCSRTRHCTSSCSPNSANPWP